MKKRTGAMLALPFLLFLGGICVGPIVAFAGSHSDVSPGEQAAALFSGIAMVVFGIIGFGFGARVRSDSDLRIPLICAAGELVSWGVLLVAGP